MMQYFKGTYSIANPQKIAVLLSFIQSSIEYYDDWYNKKIKLTGAAIGSFGAHVKVFKISKYCTPYVPAAYFHVMCKSNREKDYEIAWREFERRGIGC